MKRKFAPTMEFVEEYLKDVVSQHFPFGDKDKNELTLEVKQIVLHLSFKLSTFSLFQVAPQLDVFDLLLSSRW